LKTRSGIDEHLRDLLAVARALPPGQLESVCLALEAATSVDLLGALGAGDGVVNSALRESVRRTISDWGNRHPGESFSGLAWALRGAAAMDHWWSENSRLDVLWTGPSRAGNTFRRTEQALLEILASASEELWLVSFVGYKLPSVRDALLVAAERGVRVHMVIESPEESQGKVTFSALKGLGAPLADVVTVYVWPLAKRPRNDKGEHGSLHVKCALADDERLFVSSANLTEFAMSLNMELGVLARGGALPASIGAHFRWLVEQRILVAVPRK
jgi:phosphatidylserine/phosphatidylglycerophosphate/cardiolipin synthase-like enzyme